LKNTEVQASWVEDRDLIAAHRLFLVHILQNFHNNENIQDVLKYEQDQLNTERQLY